MKEILDGNVYVRTSIRHLCESTIYGMTVGLENLEQHLTDITLHRQNQFSFCLKRFKNDTP